MAKMKAENAKKKNLDTLNKSMEEKIKVNLKNGNIKEGSSACDQLIDKNTLNNLKKSADEEKKNFKEQMKENKKKMKENMLAKGLKVNKSAQDVESSDEDNKIEADSSPTKNSLPKFRSLVEIKDDGMVVPKRLTKDQYLENIKQNSQKAKIKLENVNENRLKYDMDK